MEVSTAALFPEASYLDLIERGQFIRTSLSSIDMVPSANVSKVAALAQQVKMLNQHRQAHGAHLYDDIVLHPGINEWVLVYDQAEERTITVIQFLEDIHKYAVARKAQNEALAAITRTDGLESGGVELMVAEIKDSVRSLEQGLAHHVGADPGAINRLVKAMCTPDSDASIAVNSSNGVGVREFPKWSSVAILEADRTQEKSYPTFEATVLGCNSKMERLLLVSDSGVEFYLPVPRELRSNPPKVGHRLVVRANDAKPAHIACVGLVSGESPRQGGLRLSDENQRAPE
ncbi:hypothetical protein [Pseudoxanthomonas sp.]|uniref:hypothetical protein n=1 Tax=Pseudoxanthomonas sp. TaxID=1871049 RepID=UPI0025E05F34|nr:hypothetical protein [Pseudoxanthomonas sp.]